MEKKEKVGVEGRDQTLYLRFWELKENKKLAEAQQSALLKTLCAGTEQC